MNRFVRWLLPALLIATPVIAQKYGGTHYVGTPAPSACDSLCGSVLYYLTDAWDFTNTGTPNGHITAILDRKSSMITTTYNSLTDNYIGASGDDEEELWHQFLVDKGETAQEEKIYLHFSETTVLCYEWNGANHTCWGVEFAAGDRVPVYAFSGASDPRPTGTPLRTENCCTASSCGGNENVYPKNYTAVTGVPLQRYVVNFADSVAGDRARVRQLYKEFLCDWIGTKGDIPNDSRYVKGIFFDNCAFNFYGGHEGTPTTGGHIREQTSIGAISWSGNFPNWLNNGPSGGNGRIAFMRALQDTLSTAGSWSPAYPGGNITTVLNVADAWGNSAFNGTEGDLYFAENQLSLSRAQGQNLPNDFYNASVDKAMWWTSGDQRTCCAQGSSYTVPIGINQYGAYGLYKLVHSGDDYWSMQYNTNQCDISTFASNKRWKEKVFGVGVVESTTTVGRRAYLGGSPSGAPFVAKSGTSYNNNSYKVWQRDYPNGFVWVRQVDDYDSTLDSTLTDEVVDLPQQGAGKRWRKVLLNGTLEGMQYIVGEDILMGAGRAQIWIQYPYNPNVPCKTPELCEEIE